MRRPSVEMTWGRSFTLPLFHSGSFMKILFTGGGTLGPVTPLLAVADAWRKKDSSMEFIWAGTSAGPERFFVEKEGIRFFAIATARFTRYISIEWILLPFRFLFACAQSCVLIAREKPDLIASAGGFTAVPIAIIGSMFGVPTWIHQSDVEPVVTNRLLAPFAKLITVAFEQTKSFFPASKTVVVGNPVRLSILHGSVAHAKLKFAIDESKPTVLVFGGGGGAQWLNEVMSEIWERVSLVANVIHVTGKGKSEKNKTSIEHHYHVVEYLAGEMADVLALADLVVCRAGTGTITELSALKKASIMIPLPNSPQEKNAAAVSNGAIVLEQKNISADDLLSEIRILLLDDRKRMELGETIATLMPTDIAGKLVDMLEHVAKK